MRTLILTTGETVLVDDDDFEKLKTRKWYGEPVVRKMSVRMYAKTVIDGKHIKMHRIILEAKPGQIIDHKDGNGLNNQKHNLRFCSSSDNQKNKKPYGRSKFKGVSWHKGKWLARINENGKQRSLGRYHTEEEAALAYDKAAKETGNEFYLTNGLI